MGQALGVTDAPLTLAIDCGGSGIKGSIVSTSGELLTERIRHETPYPLSPERLMEIIEQIAGALPAFDRVTVGMPGMIRGGRVIETPHYITTAGPFTPVDSTLRDAWFGFDLQTVLTDRLSRPTLVLNDADVQGFGVISGVGMEVVITLGTGFGTAYYLDGQVGTHLELSQAPVRKNVNYDQWIGDLARRDVGDERWSSRVLRALDAMRAVFVWDRCYLGGGNTKYVNLNLPDDVTIVPNLAGITGGAKAWEFLGH
jgi:polyphosphate glucokinase